MENNRSFYNEILTDHNLHPMHKHPLDTATARTTPPTAANTEEIFINIPSGQTDPWSENEKISYKISHGKNFFNQIRK